MQVGANQETPVDELEELRTRIRDLVMRQWWTLGVRARGMTVETNVIDPEALLLLTITVGRGDPRFFDAMLCWLEINGEFINTQRLRNLALAADPLAQAVLSAVAGRLARKAEVRRKWEGLAESWSMPKATPYFLLADGRARPIYDDVDEDFFQRGLLRPPVRKVRLAGRFPREGMAALVLRLRALIGISIRCEVLCLLGGREEIHPAELARLVGQSRRGTQSLLVEMARSGCVQVRADGRRRNYALRPGPLDVLLRPDGMRTPWVNAVPVFRSLAMDWIEMDRLRACRNGIAAPPHEECALARRIRARLAAATNMT